MEFRVLGPLEALSDGRALDLGGQKQRALLAVLLLDANRVVARERLIDALWEDDPPETARKALQVYVSQLRKTLGRERVQTRPPGYLLSLDDDELDLERFRRLRDEGRLGEALALWRGPPLAGLAELRFAQAEAARLEELRLACLEERIERDLHAGPDPGLVGELELLVRGHPLRERMRAQLMRALYRSGRQAEALAAYQDARRALVEELGIEPGRELRELEQAILRQDPALEPAPARAATDGAREDARGAFVGREAELAELVAGLEDAFAGRGRLFLLVGEPGIGKSRLAEELAARARARGARVLVGRCWEAGGAPAYWPWVQSLRAYVRENEAAVLRAQLGDGAGDLAQVIPELRHRFPDLPEPPALEAEGARFRLFDATAEFLRSAAAHRPILLVLDDLHAADTPSLLLLQFLARQLGTSRLLVVGALRDVDPTPGEALAATLTELAREPVTTTLALDGLAETEVARYVELVAGEAPTPELVAALTEETEGNPLFVGEIVRLLAAEGSLDRRAATSRAIPAGVRDVIARRLVRLSPECNRVLVNASVLGREFPVAALGLLVGLSDDDLLEALDEGLRARVLADVPGSDDRLRFAHVLIRDTLYDGLTTVRRVRLHRLALEALETLYGSEPGQHLAELAHHSIAGSEFESGISYAQRAGNWALARLAHEEAARLYQVALDALDLVRPGEEATRCELFVSLGEAEIRAGRNAQAKSSFLAAAELARRLGLPRELARAAAGYGGRMVWARAGDDHRLVPLLEEGIAAVPEDEIELRARLLARLAGALRDEPTRERRDRLSREALELARRAGDPAALAYALDGRAYAILGPDTIAEALELSTELRDLALRLGDRERLTAAHMSRSIQQLFVGDLRGAERDLEAASRIADELGQPSQRWQVRADSAMLALGTGRLADAEAFGAQAFALGESAQPESAVPIHRLHRLVLAEARGSLEEVEQEIAELASAQPARPVFRCALVLVHAKLGREADARTGLGALAANRAAALPFDQEWLFGMSMLAEAAALLADPVAAASLYEPLLPWAALNAVDVAEGFRGAVSRYLGLLAATTGRLDDAARHFEQAVAMNAHMGARPWLAATQRDYGRLLLARGRPGDRERGRELLRRADAIYRELGLNDEPGR